MSSIRFVSNVLQLGEVADFEALTFNLSLNPPFCQAAVMCRFYSPLLDFFITLFGGIDLCPISDFLSIPFTKVSKKCF